MVGWSSPRLAASPLLLRSPVVTASAGPAIPLGADAVPEDEEEPQLCMPKILAQQFKPILQRMNKILHEVGSYSTNTGAGWS